MIKEEFLEKFSKDVLQKTDVITEGTSLLDLHEWDSLAQIATISFFDKELGIAISFQDVQAAKSIDDFLKVL